MTKRIEGEGPDKIPPHHEQKTEEISEDIRISRAPSREKMATEGVREVKEGFLEPLEPLPGKVAILDVDNLISEVEKDKELLDRLLNASLVAPETSPPLKTQLENNQETLLEAAKTYVEAGENWAQLSGGVLAIPGAVIEGAHDYFAKPVGYLVPLITVDDVIQKMADGVTKAELIFKIPQTLGKGASLIYKRTVLDMLDLQIQNESNELKKFPDVKKHQRLKELKAWMKVQYDLLLAEADAFGFEAVSLIPRALGICAEMGGNIGKVFDLASTGAFAIVTVAASSFAVHTARKKIKTHEEWQAMFKEPPLAEKPITGTIKVELKDGERRVFEVPAPPKEMVEAVNKLLDNRKKAQKMRMNLNQNAFINWALPIAKSQKSFQIIKDEFKEKGVDLDNLETPIKSHEELLLALESPEKSVARMEMLKQYAEKKETISTLIKNGLKALAAKKHSVEKKFMHFNLTTSAFSLSLSTLAFAAILTLKILAVAAIIVIPAAALGYTGIGLLVVGIAILAIGLAFLAYYKPNFFSELIRGVHLKLTLYSIPHAFHNFRLNLNRIKSLKSGLELAKMSAQIEQVKSMLENKEIISSKQMPKELKPLLKKFQGDMDEMIKNKDWEKILQELMKLQKEETARVEEQRLKLEAKAAEIEKDLKKWADLISPLKQRLINAGWKDFERNANLAKTAPKVVSGKQIPSEELGLENVLVEGILNDENYLDPQLKKMLNEQLGIDLEQIRNKKGSDRENIAKELQEALKTFFSMDESALINFIKHQKAKFEFGVLG